MYYIKKYSNGWAIHNDDNGESRLLNEEEVKSVRQEFLELENEKVVTVFADEVKSIPAFVKTPTGKQEKP
jgi:hypothetical protein